MQPLGSGNDGPPIVTRFFTPASALAPYISTYYLTEVHIGEGERLSDWLHPEWANLRFFSGGSPMAAVGESEPEPVHRFALAGPTSHAVHFSTGAMRVWGIGLLPLGWAKFIPEQADQYADRFVDGAHDPAGAPFSSLSEILCTSVPAKPAEQAAQIDAHLLSLLARAQPDNAPLLAAHAALADPDMASVSDLANRIGMSGRSVERLSRRAFGFPPKLLLRRQRFLRTLAQVMLDPAQRWVSSLDQQYHDQAHFARDFQRFMGMSARQYMALPHPFLGAAVHGRMAATGTAMQALQRPDTQDG